MDVKGCTEVMGWKEGVSAGTMEADVFTLNGEGVRMFRSILQHVTGMVSMVRKRFQKSSGPSKGKKTTFHRI